mmetsp:Transcript_24331/g.63926  ORF Transcript_24331/g.63926 Transcript_24331/m.63926 type:complete len:225 (+) Transcript_24331:900-1574(+)
MGTSQAYPARIPAGAGRLLEADSLPPPSYSRRSRTDLHIPPADLEPPAPGILTLDWRNFCSPPWATPSDRHYRRSASWLCVEGGLQQGPSGSRQHHSRQCAPHQWSHRSPHSRWHWPPWQSSTPAQTCQQHGCPRTPAPTDPRASEHDAHSGSTLQRASRPPRIPRSLSSLHPPNDQRCSDDAGSHALAHAQQPCMQWLLSREIKRWRGNPASESSPRQPETIV